MPLSCSVRLGRAPPSAERCWRTLSVATDASSSWPSYTASHAATNLARPFSVGTAPSPKPAAGVVAAPAMRLPMRSLFGDLSRKSRVPSSLP
ncbi:hypothetical protein D3C71_2035780 [compost metagenome]